MSQINRETRNVVGFDSINLQGLGDIFLTQENSESLVLEGDEELLSRIKTEVNDGELVISYKNWFDFIMMPRNLKIFVTLKTVHGIKVSGKGSLHAPKITTDRLRLETSGSSSMEIDDLSADSLAVNISGSGELDLAGRATSLDLQVSGSGKVESRNLDCQKASVRVSGSCQVTLKVEETLDVKISGSADLRYIGAPKIEQRVSGSASVRRIEVRP